MRCYSFDPKPNAKYEQKIIGMRDGLQISANANGVSFQFGDADSTGHQIVVEMSKSESKQAAEFLSSLGISQ